MALVCFVADGDSDTRRLACQLDGPFQLEVLELPLEVTGVLRQAPAALVLPAGIHAAPATTLNLLREMEGPPVLALARAEDLTRPELLLWHDFTLWPWDPGEVSARLRRLTHRDDPAGIMRWGRLLLDDERHEVQADGVALDLTYTEFRLLALLMEMSGKVVTRERAYKDIWGSDHFGGLRTVDVHIRRLRSKLESRACPYIGTVRNVGYRMREAQDPEALQVP